MLSLYNNHEFKNLTHPELFRLTHIKNIVEYVLGTKTFK